MIALLLQAQPAPPGAPWWAVLGGPLVGLMISGLFTVLVARAQRGGDTHCKAEIPEIKRVQGEHGDTLAAHGEMLSEHEAALGERTDPSAKAIRSARDDDRLRALETALADVRAEQRASDKARHEADGEMKRSIGRIEGALGIGGSRDR